PAARRLAMALGISEPAPAAAAPIVFVVVAAARPAATAIVIIAAASPRTGPAIIPVVFVADETASLVALAVSAGPCISRHAVRLIHETTAFDRYRPDRQELYC